MLAPFAILLVWGAGVEPHLIDERREEVSIPNLGADWDGREVAVLADVQLGFWGANARTARRIVQRVVEHPPAAVLLAGDFVYKADGRLEENAARVGALMKPLTDAGIPTFAVLGNHDYSMHWEDDPPVPEAAAEVQAALEQVGVRVLRNDSVWLVLVTEDGRESEPLYVVGIDDLWAGQSRPVAAVLGVPEDAARIVFMHNPASFRDLPPGTAPLAVAAHTHGGQISLPFIPHWSWTSWVNHDQVEPHGWASDREEPLGNRLYVNVGIGFSDIPIRINARPELTRFTLRSASGGPLPK